MLTHRLLISGRVQGVGFRYYFERAARQYGVTGWVRNRRDGTVEAVIHGEPDAVAAMTAWARQGPSSAVVSRVDVRTADGDYDAFEIRPTE